MNYRKFWKTVKPVLSDKGRSNQKIALIEDEKIISNDEEIAETLNDYCATVTGSLGIAEYSNIISRTEGATDPIEKARLKYSNHPSIRKTRNFAQNVDPFNFQKVSLEQMDNEIRRLNRKKATTLKDIPAKVLKSNSNVCSESLQLIFNNCIENGLFPDSLKLANIVSLYKMNEETRKKNYRPVNVLPTVSKVFEIITDGQITTYISHHLSSLLCGFRKGYNT